MTNFLATLRTLDAAATKGPWVPCLGSGQNMMTNLASDTERDGRAFICDFQPDYFDKEGYTPEASDYRPDMNLTVFLRNHAAAIAGCVEALEECLTDCEMSLAPDVLLLARRALAALEGE